VAIRYIMPNLVNSIKKNLATLNLQAKMEKVETLDVEMKVAIAF
jgi:hypothetical protein